MGWCSAGNVAKSPYRMTLDSKAETLLGKFPCPFPCPLLTIILLSIFVPFLVQCWLLFLFAYLILTWFMSQAFWNCWNLLSFIGVETSHRRGIEKRSVIDVVTSIINGVATGMNFLQLWGEERALRFRTGTTSLWFNHNTCLMKPE